MTQTITPIAAHYHSIANNANYIQTVSKLPEKALRTCSDDKTEKSYTYISFTLAARGLKLITGNGYYRSQASFNAIIQQDLLLTINLCDGIQLPNINNNNWLEFSLAHIIHPSVLVYIHANKNKIPSYYEPLRKLYKEKTWIPIQIQNSWAYK